MHSKSYGVLLLLSFLFSGIAAAMGAGLLAAAISSTGWAPVGIFSLGVGILVGLLVLGLAHGYKINCPKRLVAAAVLMALVTVPAQHFWLYRNYCQQWFAVREREPALALFRPESAPMSLGEYFAAEYSPGRLAFWGADAALVVAAAVGTVVLYQRRQISQTTGGASSAANFPPPTPDS